MWISVSLVMMCAAVLLVGDATCAVCETDFHACI